MRVRTLELRLLAVGLAVLWAIVAGLLLAGYRPGGPADLLVGLAALAPLAVALAAVAWPPAARGDLAFRTIAALGVATAIVLVPTMAGLARQLVERGLQTLLPSPEAAYPWALAMLGTSLFAGLGIARRLLGAGSRRPVRLRAAVALGIGLAASRAPCWRARRSRTSSPSGIARRPPPATGRRTRPFSRPCATGRSRPVPRPT